MFAVNQKNLPYKEDKFDLVRLLYRVVLVLFALFVGYLVNISKKYGEEGALVIFKDIRNKAYFVFVVILVVCGFWIMAKGKREEKSSEASILSALALALVLLTFSYSSASLVVDFLRVVGLF